jgi:hypothetical protein
MATAPACDVVLVAFVTELPDNRSDAQHAATNSSLDRSLGTINTTTHFS